MALLMMSVPGLANRSYEAPPQPSFESFTHTPAVLVPPPASKKRFSFLRRSAASATTGIASWYGAVLNGHRTASGEIFDMNQMTACHRTLPFGTMVRVVDTHSGKSVIVRINDRGVLFADRVIDLSRGAAERLGIRSMGTASVRLEVLTKKQIAQTEMAAAGIPAALAVAAPQPTVSVLR